MRGGLRWRGAPCDALPEHGSGADGEEHHEPVHLQQRPRRPSAGTVPAASGPVCEVHSRPVQEAVPDPGPGRVSYRASLVTSLFYKASLYFSFSVIALPAPPAGDSGGAAVRSSVSAERCSALPAARQRRHPDLPDRSVRYFPPSS